MPSFLTSCLLFCVDGRPTVPLTATKREFEITFNLEIKCAFSYREKLETNEIVSFIVKTSSVFILKDSKKVPGFCSHDSCELGLLISVVCVVILP